jgi:hypothetical protein
LVWETARLGTTQPSFEVAAETLGRLTRLWISDTTVWRHHGEVTGQIETALVSEEKRAPFWAHEEEQGAQAWITAQDPVREHVNVSIDGTTVRIREEGHREVKMVAVSDAVSHPVPNVDFAQSSQEAQGVQDDLKLTRHSYRAVLGEKEVFRPALEGELTRRRVREAAQISTVNDGSEWIWDLVAGHLPATRVEVLDWPHAVQNLAKAGDAAWGEGTPAAQAWLAQRKTELWQGQVRQVRVALHALPPRRKERGTAIRQVRQYTVRHAKRMDYAHFRAAGRPIGSGTVESGAKNVVSWRMKRGGQSWSRNGAQRMLAGLGELHSKRFDDACRRLTIAA